MLIIEIHSFMLLNNNNIIIAVMLPSVHCVTFCFVLNIYLPYLANPYISSGNRGLSILSVEETGAQKLTNLLRIILVISDRAGL